MFIFKAGQPWGEYKVKGIQMTKACDLKSGSANWKGGRHIERERSVGSILGLSAEGDTWLL